MDARFDRLETRLNELELHLIRIHQSLDAINMRYRNHLIRSGQPFHFQPDRSNTSLPGTATTASSPAAVRQCE